MNETIKNNLKKENNIVFYNNLVALEIESLKKTKNL